MRQAYGVGSHLVQWKTKCLALSQGKPKWSILHSESTNGPFVPGLTLLGDVPEDSRVHICAHTVTWWFRKSSHMGRSKAQQDIPVTLALVSNTSMSTSKYEGSLKNLQMEDKQKLEKNVLRQLIFLLLSFHLPWAALVHCQSLLRTTLKYDSVPES